MKVKVDIVTSDDVKIYYTGKFQDFTARYNKEKLKIIMLIRYIINRIFNRLFFI